MNSRCEFATATAHAIFAPSADAAATTALGADPRHAAHAHWQAALDLAGQGHWRAAARSFGRAARAVPGDALYWVNLANAQRRAGALPRAVAAARRALRLAPGHAVALQVLGVCLAQMHRHAEAVQALAELEATGETTPELMAQHGSSLLSLERPGEAATVLLRALAIKPELVIAHGLLAEACRDQGLKREALECMRTVLALQPGNLEALARVSFEKRQLCDWRDWHADRQRIEAALAAAPQGVPRVALMFSLLSLPLPPALLLAGARCDALQMARNVQPLPPVPPAERRGRKIRLGFVSFDFRMHPVSQLLVAVLEAIDRERFDVVLYSSGPDDGSPLRRRLVAAADEFVELRGLSDRQAAQRIRRDGIDLLLDLMGHTRGQRLSIFAFRPAPVQAGYLGFAGSSGADYIDYLVGDPLATPLALAQQFQEKLAQLPLTFQPNSRDRPLPQPMTRAAAGLPEHAFVMCAFNHTYKITPEVMDTWCSLLRQLPHAVLWLKETSGQLHDNVWREAAARGIARDRVIFARTLSYEEHFSRLALADVFIDSWPYNGHTTASDALWAGVPVLSHYGNAYASRVAASVLNAAGLGELAFGSLDEYRNAILALALNPELLAGYRHYLTAERMNLPLFDTGRYTRELEALFGRMVGRWRAGLPCEHLLADVAAETEAAAAGATASAWAAPADAVAA
jgi:predicted O-linked N-acetylglucosamine transferase (SPINDLY family)